MSDKVIKELKVVQEDLKKDILDLKKEFRGLIEIQQRLIHEIRLNVQMPNPPLEYGNDNKKEVVKTSFDEKIKISNLGSDRIKIEGKTFDYKHLIKSSGYARWESELKVWSLPIESLDILVEKFKQVDFTDKDIKIEVIKKVVETYDTIDGNNDENIDENYGFI